MRRIVDIASDNRHLAQFRGFLTVSEGSDEVGRVALDDIAAVIVHGHGITYSNNLFVALAERVIPLTLCAPNHAPVACLWPLSGHHAQGARMRAQWDAPRPLGKQLWRDVVVAKIRMQAAVIAAIGGVWAGLDRLAKDVRSGDPDNIEAQAARRYWPALFGESFRRDQDGGGINGPLNYGYTVLRALTARALVASGLHPTIGIHHSNRGNAFALADDLMEPFRPLIDMAVWLLAQQGETEVTPAVKRRLAALADYSLDGSDAARPIATLVERAALSLAQSFETGRATLELPEPPTPLALRAMLAQA